MKDLSTALLIGALILLPLTIWGETSSLRNWNNRLAIPYLTSQPDRHTSKHTTGTVLPSVISEDLSLAPVNNPVLLTTTTRTNAGITLKLAPGTTIYAHEFSGIIIEGRLSVQGTKEQPVLFTSNEIHPLNQTWSGITITKGAQATITHATFHYASPTLTCLVDSNATLTNTHITDTILAVFNANPNCYVRTF